MFSLSENHQKKYNISFWIWVMEHFFTLIRCHFISLWLILNYSCCASPSKISLVAHNKIQSTYHVYCVIKPNWKHKKTWQSVQIYVGFTLWGFTLFCLSTNHSWNNPKWSKPSSSQYHFKCCREVAWIIWNILSLCALTVWRRGKAVLKRCHPCRTW